MLKLALHWRKEGLKLDRHWNGLENLILVAGHAVYTAADFRHPFDDESWYLQSFQEGEPPFYIEHIHRGVELANQDKKALLIFSGGQTRLEAGPKSEAQSYWMVANHAFRWWAMTNVMLRSTTEEFARDSLENIVFGICRFRECAGRIPANIVLVSWKFKEKRFEMHRKTIGFPALRFTFDGVNNPVNLNAAENGEKKTAVEPFSKDRWGIALRPKDSDPKEDKATYLGTKRKERNPFGRQHPYATSCPEMVELLKRMESTPTATPEPENAPQPAVLQRLWRRTAPRVIRKR
jgi:hypothetical protein